MTHIFVTRRIPGLGALPGAIVWPDALPPTRDALLHEAANADALLTLVTDRIDAEVMDAAPNLKVISNFAVGYDNIDIAAATARGIPVGNTPGVLTETTADLAFALLLAAARRIDEAARFVRAGKWQTWEPTLLLGQEVNGATLGIIGLGRIGQAVARRGAAFGMRLLHHGGTAPAGLPVEARSLDDLLAESDFVTLHVPYKPETHHLIDAAALAKMKPTAILMNTARGPIVDSAALYEALASGQIAYAALDVTEPEPLPVDDPLLTLENCLIVPHIGSGTVATRNKMAQMAIANLQAGLRGERLPNCVNPEVYNTFRT